ncbi:alpha/beta hydrolase family protein [Youngiibacter multivorans]|uniref:Dipeptidyl aminopeptidase/acylaminoacyl peptidase n=1 Tax=Youngiibacter multivorans TaxID=937251 RepID=A0ABS4G4X7_9CLOT|nr:S9 family peptidase [Youngiibacter multivorans]MBP1919615.1 dipeptidyl aminopeptidase/acylaminoacyl peptidase [Youngiibacter multivorans]
MERLTIEDFKNYRFLSGIRHSPDGKNACFVVHLMNLEENRYDSTLYILNVESGKTRKLTSSNKETQFKWLDDENIVFTAMRDEKDKEKSEALEEITELYKINIHGGEADKYLSFKKELGTYEFLFDGSVIATVTFDSNSHELLGLEGEDRSKELKRRKEEKDYEVLEEIPYWSNGSGFTSRKRSRLALFNSDGSFKNYITGEFTDVESLRINKSKDKAVIIATTFKDKMELANDVLIYSDGKLSSPPLIAMNYGYAGFLDDEHLVLTGSNMLTYGLNENKQIFTSRIDGSDFRNLSPEMDLSLYNSVGTDSRYGSSQEKTTDRGFLYFLTTEGTDCKLRRIDAGGNLDEVISITGTVDGFSVCEGNIIYIGMQENSLQEIYSSGSQEPLTSFNTGILKDRTVSIPERLVLKSSGSTDIEGFVIRPAMFEEGKKYPCILSIHGGPKTVFGNVFHHEMQVLSNLGYFVVYCNPRGSDGKGNEFSDIRGKYGTIDYEDIISFLDKAIETYAEIDSDRIGVTGGSYGGFMTNWIIGHSDRFKAAVSERSISNWISMYSTTDIGYYFASDQIGETPWTDSEKLWWHSPLKYADKVRTPTLFLHSDEDYRCWLVEGLQMYTALKDNSVPARFCMFKGENHELSRSGKPLHRIRRLKEMTEWFGRYL